MGKPGERHGWWTLLKPHEPEKTKRADDLFIESHPIVLDHDAKLGQICALLESGGVEHDGNVRMQTLTLQLRMKPRPRSF